MTKQTTTHHTPHTLYAMLNKALLNNRLNAKQVYTTLKRVKNQDRAINKFLGIGQVVQNGHTNNLNYDLILAYCKWLVHFIFTKGEVQISLADYLQRCLK